MEGDDDKVGIHGRFANLIGRSLLPIETRDKTKVACKGWKKEGIEGKIISGDGNDGRRAPRIPPPYPHASTNRYLENCVDFSRWLTSCHNGIRENLINRAPVIISLISFESKARETWFQIAAFYRGLTIFALSIGRYRRIRATQTSFDMQRDSRHRDAKDSSRHGRSDRSADAKVHASK